MSFETSDLPLQAFEAVDSGIFLIGKYNTMHAERFEQAINHLWKLSSLVKLGIMQRA